MYKKLIPNPVKIGMNIIQDLYFECDTKSLSESELKRFDNMLKSKMIDIVEDVVEEKPKPKAKAK